MLHKVGGSNTKSNQTLNIIFCVVIKGSWRWLKTNVHRIQPSTKLPQWNFNDKVHHNPKLLDDGGGIPKSQGRGWRLDSRLCNLLSPSHTTCQVVNCLMMMVENYQNLKEEVGCSIPGYEISCLLDIQLGRWWTASWWWWRNTEISRKRLAVRFPSMKSPLHLTNNLVGGELPHVLWRWHVAFYLK